MTKRTCHECGTVIEDGPSLEVGGLTLDRIARRAAWRGRSLKLEPRLFHALALLAARAGRAVQEWVIETGETDARRTVCDIRNAFRAIDPGFDRIETVRGIGYRWRAD